MSRIGKLPIDIPDKVEVTLKERHVTVKGPRGTLQWEYPAGIQVKLDGKKVHCTLAGDAKDISAKHGLTRALIKNMVVGVSAGFTKNLSLVGVGYRAKVEGKKLILTVGFSHPVEMLIPEGLKVSVSQKMDEIEITGADRQLVGEWTAVVRRVRLPEPYKGKGIRYKNETVKTKQGKRVGA